MQPHNLRVVGHGTLCSEGRCLIYAETAPLFTEEV